MRLTETLFFDPDPNGRRSPRILDRDPVVTPGGAGRDWAGDARPAGRTAIIPSKNARTFSATKTMALEVGDSLRFLGLTTPGY